MPIVLQRLAFEFDPGFDSYRMIGVALVHNENGWRAFQR